MICYLVCFSYQGWFLIDALAEALFVWSSEVIADGRRQLNDNHRTASEEGSGKRRQRTALQVMLEARDDDGNPVGFPPHFFPVFMHEGCCLCLNNALAPLQNVSLRHELVGMAT